MRKGKRRTIAVVTGTRAEFGILAPLLVQIRKSSSLRLQLIVTGMHLLNQYGMTVREVQKSFPIASCVPMYQGKESKPGFYEKALSRGIVGMGDVFAKLKPDSVVVFGDRLEAFAAAVAAATEIIPIAHIHGGDKTDSGHIDESVRHAITRFAHIHFPATASHGKRLLRMGEEPWRIFPVGALGLDSILYGKKLSRKELSAKLAVNFDQPVLVCLFHPVHLEQKTIGIQMKEVIAAIKIFGLQTIFIYPNNDSGSDQIIAQIESSRSHPQVKVFSNLDHASYRDILRYARVLIGNSSSGIIEAPSFGLPVVHVGSRNRGREHARNLLFVKPKKDAIIQAVNKALYDKRFLSRVGRAQNPYGEGKAAVRIRQILERMVGRRGLLLKKITY